MRSAERHGFESRWSPEIFSGLIGNCLNCDHNCDSHILISCVSSVGEQNWCEKAFCLKRQLWNNHTVFICPWVDSTEADLSLMFNVHLISTVKTRLASDQPVTTSPWLSCGLDTSLVIFLSEKLFNPTISLTRPTTNFWSSLQIYPVWMASLVT